MDKKLVMATVFAAAIGVNSYVTAAPAETHGEKCFGIAKAGMNDCKAKDNSHSCAGLAKVDGEKQSFLMVPTGMCNKIVGGSTQ